MTVNQLGNETTTVFADGAEFVMERVFDAPRELVWQALTDPERIPRWWGKRHTTMTVEEMDVRVGGRWRWVAHTPDGDAPFSGEYLEIEPPGRLVNTEMFDVPPYNEGEPAVVTQTLEDLDGKTKLTSPIALPDGRGARGRARDGHGRRSHRELGPPGRGSPARLTRPLSRHDDPPGDPRRVASCPAHARRREGRSAVEIVVDNLVDRPPSQAVQRRVAFAADATRIIGTHPRLATRVGVTAASVGGIHAHVRTVARTLRAPVSSRCGPADTARRRRRVHPFLPSPAPRRLARAL